MRIAKKIFIGLMVLALLAIVLNFGISWYLREKLPSVIHKEKNFPYNISYEDLDVNLITGSLTLHNVYAAPKDTLLNQGAFAKVDRISVRRFNLWAFLREDKIKVNRVIIESPKVQLYEKDKRYSVEDDVVKPFKNSINTGSIEVNNGNFKLLSIKHKPLLKAANINLVVENIKVDSAIVASNIPVRYTDYNFSCDSLFYHIDNVYNMTALKVTSTDSTITVDKLKLIPKYTRAQYTKSLAKEKDLFAVNVHQLKLPNVQWGYINNVLFVHSPELILDRLNANVYRNKLPADDPTTKKLYSQLLRELDFDLDIGKVMLKNSLIEYEEQLDWTRPAAKVSFSNFYATIHNVYSPINKKKLPRTVADVQCLFMKHSPLTVKWIFNVPDKSDSFTINGHLRNIDTGKIDPLAKPLMNFTAEGTIKELRYTMNGNRNSATGTFAMEYDDFKVDIYKKDGKEKNKFLSAIGNLIVKNDSNDKLKNADIEVVRLKDKSVFNFLWRFLQEGLKKTLLPKAVNAVLPKKKKMS
ncbi:hypothetical protein LRS05_01085 [Flavobacterium sp. J372]|uniref:hypothetical protein n=1 Tax=Flavobacterium sp. J372 TaxID=2898436 RepID=UPI002151C32A|nr:hypothetical protein [Flavobacterium sp. J372]MCR5860827.1 hypothetical protein [Flavobacterium sp. J372]